MNKFSIIFISAFFIFSSLFAQNDKESFVEINFGLSRHGTGDLPGFNYGFSYGEEFGNRLFWQIGMEGSTHDSEDLPVLFTDENGNEINGTLHEVISGFQIVSGFQYNLVQSNSHQFGLSLLALGRYQVLPFDGIVATIYPSITELPFPVRAYDRKGPSRTIAFGGSFRINYQYTLGNNLFLGIQGAFQTDTNGDAILSASASFGKRF